MTENCKEFVEYEDGCGVPWYPVNCPKCGRWLKWDNYHRKYSCSNGCDLITITYDDYHTEGKVCTNPLHNLKELKEEESIGR